MSDGSNVCHGIYEYAYIPGGSSAIYACDYENHHSKAYALGMTIPLAAKIRMLRKARRLTQAEFADALDMETTQATISRWETGSVPEGLAIAALAKYAGVSVEDFLGGESLEQSSASQSSPPIHKIRVIGAVSAGIWRERVHWLEDEVYEMEVGPPPYPGIERFGLVVEGFSMDKLFPPGTELDCLRIPFNGSGLAPKPGDLVIVERRKGDLCETTCKRLAIDDAGDYVLLAESTKPEFQEPIHIGRPDKAHFEDSEAIVIAIVNRSYQSHFKR